MKVSDLFVKCLEKEGVKYVFGLPGEENEDLLFSLQKSSIKFISTRHEQGAAFMADVWGRLTGKAGVCLATLGPGATNLITGLSDAHMDKSPVVAITGQGSSERLHKESHQAIDIVGMLKPITKWNISIHNPSITTEAIRKAFKLSQLEKPGVTHIELPEDVAKIETEGTPISPTTVRRPAVDYKALQKAVDLIASSKKPVIIAGNGSIRKLASKHLRMFVEKFNIPTVATFMGKGAVSDKDPRSLFSMGLRGKDFPLYAIDESDLLISVGFDIAEYSPDIWNLNPQKPIIHIDFESSEVYESYQPQVELIADISDTLWQLNIKLEEKQVKPFPNWFTKIRVGIEKDLKNYEKSSKKDITIPWVLSKIRKYMGDEDIIISDVGSHKMWIGRNFPVYTPGTCIISNGFATMGIALPGGIAAKLAYPDRKVVSVSGDGGFLMNSQEIETAKRYNIPFTIIVLNDNDYGLISWKQKSHTGKSFGTGLTNPDYKKYGESFGIKTYVPKNKEDVDKALKKAISSNEITLVAIDIDPSENLRLTKKINSKLL